MDAKMDAKKQDTKARTMGDAIRQSSDPELADILLAFSIDLPACQNRAECMQLLEIQKAIPESMCKRCISYWLESTAPDASQGNGGQGFKRVLEGN